MNAYSQAIADYDFQAELARGRALGAVERTVRELAANIFSVVHGTGRPEMIGPQAQAVVYAMDAHRSVAGFAPSRAEIAAVLNIAAKAERVALLNIEYQEQLRVTQDLISRALPIAASRLTEIRSHTPGGVEGLTPDDYAPSQQTAQRPKAR